MCGICGIINFNQKPVEKNNIRQMMSKIKHRGPDDEGTYISKNVGLGHVRLSILDLSNAGHQPMFSNDGRFVIVYNGEIYNYIELKKELSDNYKFKTKTDTEVILAAYQKWGEDCLEKFNGMFAFVIYDLKTNNIFGARDRFGIKPFYYYQDTKRLIFASELKSILPLIKREPDNKIIYDYLMYNRTDHTEKTFFKNIQKLNHGSYFTINNNVINISRWYLLSEKLGNKILSPMKFREIFEHSLKLRLRADVPVGVSLSGGIDSSSIVSSLIKDFHLNELNTFSAVYGTDEPSDESEFIKEFRPIVKNMHYIYPDADSFYKDYENFIEAHNEPIANIGPYAQFKVMELAGKHVTVTLDGQGADEQLAGYHYFFASYYIELIKKIKFMKLLSESFYYIKKHKSVKIFQHMIYYLLPSYLQKKANNFRYPSITQEFLNTNKFDTQINEMLFNPNSLNHLLAQHFEYKLEHLLKWEDLNAMNFSIESRVPFLDHNLVENTLSTPSDQKINKGETKHLLRESLKDILPDKIVRRKDKKGFSNPRDKWFRNPKFKELILDIINSRNFKSRGFFDSSIANKQYQKHLDKKADLSKEIWKWVNLEIWFRKFIDEKV